MGKRPTAFVSYAQSSPAWRELVLKFTVALRKPGGVDAEVDLFHDVDHQRWATFGANQIEESDFTLIVVDQAYKRRWLGREETGVGAGVAREAAAIRAIYERDQEEFLKRIKLVLLPGIGESDVPADLLGDCERFKIEKFDLEGLDPLLRSIFGRSAYPKPDLAPIPSLPPKAVARLEGKAGPGDADSGPEVAGARAADAADVRDEKNLRGQLRRIQFELKGTGTGNRKENLLREQTALEVSLRALSQARGPRRRARRAGARRGTADRSDGLSRWIALAAVLLTIVVTLTWVAASLSKSRDTTPRPITAKASGIRLQGPPGWRQQAGQAGISGLEIAAPVSLTAGPGRRGRELAAVAGISRAAGAKLLPAAYRRQLGDGTARAAVDLGGLEAYRYTGLETEAGYPLTVFVAPTTTGVATLACRMPKGEVDPAASRLCARMASTIRLTNGRGYPLGPSAAFAKKLRHAFARLKARQSKELGEMGDAKRASSQAAAAKRLADGFRRAAKSVASGEITPESAGGRAAVAAALRRVRDAYKRLAAAAGQEDATSYLQAEEMVAEGEKLLRRRLEELRPLGYEVGGAR
jgi:hypothetical protein